MIDVTVNCTVRTPEGRSCQQGRIDHVHQPTPCANGQDARHHDFLPPKTVAVSVEGRVRRLRVPA